MSKQTTGSIVKKSNVTSKTTAGKKVNATKNDKVVYTKRISRGAAAKLILANGSKIFTVNTGKRMMTARLGVSKGVTGSNPGTTKKINETLKVTGQVRVYDMLEKGYRTLNLQQITSPLKMAGEIYKING